MMPNIRRTFRRSAYWALATIALSASLVQAQPDPNKVMRYAFEIAETGFDPAQTSDWYSSYVFSNIFDTPLTYDYLARPLKLKPGVLEAMPEGLKVLHGARLETNTP